jgi:hypothetical protein
MRALIAGIALFFAAAGANAQSAQPTAAHADRVSPNSVLSAVTLDLDGDASFDRATLVQGEEGADLYVYLSAGASGQDAPRRLALYKKEAAWTGTMWGTLPSLHVSTRGSLLLKSGNDAIGRSRWERVLTIVFRDGQLVVAGITNRSRDTLDPSGGVACDLNLLSGHGTRNGKRVKVTAKSVLLAAWDDSALPRESE